MDLKASILLFVQITKPSSSRVTRRRPRSRNVDWNRDFKMSATNAVRSIIRQILTSYKSSKGFDKVGDKIELLSMSEGKASFKMKVEESHQNPMGNLHGGMTATLVDMLTTLVTFTSPPHKLGVSVDMSISYLRPVPVGEDVTINAEVIKMGRTLVFTGAELLNKDGKLVAKASHTKFIGEGQPTPFTEKKES